MRIATEQTAILRHSALPEILVKELDDERFKSRIFEKPDPTAAGIEPDQ